MTPVRPHGGTAQRLVVDHPIRGVGGPCIAKFLKKISARSSIKQVTCENGELHQALPRSIRFHHPSIRHLMEPDLMEI